jgi:thioredoxin reductase (NADPH)
MGDTIHNVAIIGSGPAGLTAAIYTARALLKPVVFLGREDGGQLMITSEVENIPGFPDGVQGPQYIQLLKQQSEKFGTQLLSEHVVDIDFSNRPFLLKTDDHTYQAKSIIIATGATARMLGIPSEKALMGMGVSACATCDGFFFKDKEIMVVGGGDSAMEEATFLTRFAKKVTVIHRREEFRASKIMVKRAQDNPKIDFLLNKVVIEVLGVEDKKIKGVKLQDTKTNETSEVSTEGLFIAIGHTPNTEIFKNKIDMDSKGYIIHREHTATNIEGVFAAGDIVDSRYRQAITAAGSGCQAAIDAERFLEQTEG